MSQLIFGNEHCKGGQTMGKNGILKNKAGEQIFPATTADQVAWNDRMNLKQAISEKLGAPYAASTASGMTDRTRIYVYTGDESGYTKGNWYYHNGSGWVSGGVYNSVAVETDKTLTVSGKAADGEVVGQEIDSLKESKVNYFDVENNTVFNYNTASNNHETYHFAKGHIYKICNKSTTATFRLNSIVSNENHKIIENIGTVQPGKDLYFSCNDKADGVYIYVNEADTAICQIIDMTSIIKRIDTHIYNVTKYGVLPSNTDNHDALVNMLNSNDIESPCTLFFPKGTYNFEKHTERINLPDVCTIKGEHGSLTTLHFNDTDEVGVSLFGSGKKYVALEDCKFTSTFATNHSSNNIAFLLFGEMCETVKIKRCTFEYFRGILMAINNASDIEIRDCTYNYIGRDCNRFLCAKSSIVSGCIFKHCGDDVVAFHQLISNPNKDYGHQFFNNRLEYSFGLGYLGCSNVNIHDNYFYRYMYIAKFGTSPEETLEGGLSRNINIERNVFDTPIFTHDTQQGRFSGRLGTVDNFVLSNNIFTKTSEVTSLENMVIINQWHDSVKCDNYLTIFTFHDENSNNVVYLKNIFKNQVDPTCNARIITGNLPKFFKLDGNQFMDNRGFITSLDMSGAYVINNIFQLARSGLVGAYTGIPLIEKNNIFSGISGYNGQADNIIAHNSDIAISPYSNGTNIRTNGNWIPTTIKKTKSDKVPTEGFYYKGDIVWCTDDSATMCWKRLTSGDSHIMGTDWIALYGLTEAQTI